MLTNQFIVSYFFRVKHVFICFGTLLRTVIFMQMDDMLQISLSFSIFSAFFSTLQEVSILAMIALRQVAGTHRDHRHDQSQSKPAYVMIQFLWRLIIS